MLGLPRGLIIGRWPWIAFTNQLGIETVTATPWIAGTVLVVAVLIAVQLIAVVPARSAARTNTSQALRPPR